MSFDSCNLRKFGVESHKNKPNGHKLAQIEQSLWFKNSASTYDSTALGFPVRLSKKRLNFGKERMQDVYSLFAATQAV